MAEEFDAEVAARVRRDFPPAQWGEVFALLASCEPGVPKAQVEHSQWAILELAKGDIAMVAHNVEVARTDFRDVQYWAFAADRDPWAMWHQLLDSLAESEVLSRDQGKNILEVGRFPKYLDSLPVLCDLLASEGRSITREQYEAIRKLGKRIRSKAVWLPLRKMIRREASD